MAFNLIFVINFVSGRDQEAAKWDQALAGRTETEAGEAAQWRRHRWILACDWLIMWILSSDWLQTRWPSQPARATATLRTGTSWPTRWDKKVEILKVNMSWTVSIVVKLEFSLQYMNPNSKYQIPCLTHFITCQRGHFWMKMCAHMDWELRESQYLLANS